MNNFIEKINFKRVVIVYLILLVLCVFGLLLFLGNVYKDKLMILYNYYNIKENFKKNYDQDKLNEYIDKLSSVSSDIVDVVIIKDVLISYSKNNFYKNDLVNINNSVNYFRDMNNNVYKLDNKKEFILNLFGVDEEDEKDAYYNDFLINEKESNKYVINYLKNKHNNEKLIIVSNVNKDNSGVKYLKFGVAIFMMFLMVYMIIVAMMIYQNAIKLQVNACFWGVITLFTNIIGVLMYLIYVKNIVRCKCGSLNIRGNKYCKSCGEKI